MKRLALAAVLLVATAGTASAQTGMGNYFSSPVDGDGAAPFWNPAAMTFATGLRSDLSLALGYLRINYDNPETQGRSRTSLVAPQPFIGVVTDLGTEKWRLGISTGVPYVVGARWQADEPEGQITRYYANFAYLMHAVATPAVAYQINDTFRVGAGINIAYSRLRAEYDKDFASVLNGSLGVGFDSGPFKAGDPLLAAPVSLRSAGVGVGGVLGLAIESGRIRFGASLHTPINTQATGDVDASYPEEMRQFVQSAAPAAELPELSGNVQMKLAVPLAAFSALSVQLSPRWDAAVDYRFANNASGTSFDVLISDATSPDIQDTEVVKGTRNRHSAGLRLRRTFANGRGVGLGRARYENNTVTEITTTPNNADFHKLELGAGVAWQLSKRTLLMGQFNHYLIFDREVRTSLHQPTTVRSLEPFNHPTPTGKYSAGANSLTVSLGFSY
ncbi:MAG: outer membrane protein transport protein [Deltaproteobacteria bacterium]|jgi:long-subunit fatty acid transport protein|nr:outer membrane protein transport protein [Deltaproteobacteria bacterium]